MAEGQVVHVSVLGAQGLRDTEWFTKQDPYVVLEYGHQRFRSATDIDGHTDPAFNLHVSLRVFPGMHEFTLVIWNENNLRDDNVIGSTRIDLRSALASGFDDSSWPVYNSKQVHRGSVRVVIRTERTHAAPPPFKPHSSAPYDPHHSSQYRPHLSVQCEPHHFTPDPPPPPHQQPHFLSPHHCHQPAADSASPPCQPQPYSSQQHQTAAHPAPASGPPPTPAPPASPHGSTGAVPSGGRNRENRDRMWNKVGIVAGVLGTAVDNVNPDGRQLSLTWTEVCAHVAYRR